MILEIPKFHETFNPILDILSNGETIHTRDLQLAVIKKHFSYLTDEQLSEKTKTGENLIYNRIAWGKSYLKKGGYISYPERGNVKITEKGLKQKSELTLKNVVDDSGISNFYAVENSKKNNQKVTLPEIASSSPQDLIDKGFSQIENEVKNELLEKLKTIDPYYFEKVILILLKKMGYGEFVETSKSGDGGIDGIINEDKLGLDKIYIQAKRFS